MHCYFKTIPFGSLYESRKAGLKDLSITGCFQALFLKGLGRTRGGRKSNLTGAVKYLQIPLGFLRSASRIRSESWRGGAMDHATVCQSPCSEGSRLTVPVLPLWLAIYSWGSAIKTPLAELCWLFVSGGRETTHKHATSQPPPSLKHGALIFVLGSRAARFPSSSAGQPAGTCPALTAGSQPCQPGGPSGVGMSSVVCGELEQSPRQNPEGHLIGVEVLERSS